MWSLIILQFKNNYKVWFSTLPIFGVSGFIIGVCTSGIFNLLKYYPQVVQSSNSPLPIFLMPIVFGGITVFIILKQIVFQVIRRLQAENQILVMIGMSPSQLSLILACQLMIVSAIATLLGFSIAIPSANLLYNWLQIIVGERMLPTLTIHVIPLALLITLALTVFITGASAFVNAHKKFLSVQKRLTINSTKQKKRKTWLRNGMSLLILSIMPVIWIYLYNIEKSNISGKYLALNLRILFIEIFIMVAIISGWTGYIIQKCSAVILKTSMREKIYAGLALYNIRENFEVYDAFIKPLSIVIVIGSSLSSIVINFARHQSSYSSNNGNLEFVLVIVLYLGAPILIVLANVLSTLMISSDYSNRQNRQLQLLGFSRGQVQRVIMDQAIFASVILLGFSSACSAYIGYTISLVSKITAGTLFTTNIAAIFIPSILGTVLILLIMLTQVLSENLKRLIVP